MNQLPPAPDGTRPTWALIKLGNPTAVPARPDPQNVYHLSTYLDRVSPPRFAAPSPKVKSPSDDPPMWLVVPAGLLMGIIAMAFYFSL